MIHRTDTTKFKRRLHPANPHCVYCGVLTILATPPEGTRHPWDLATIDHVKPRRECKTQQEYNAPSNKVIACRRCNARRDVVENHWLLDQLIDLVPPHQWFRVRHLRDAISHLYYAVKFWRA